MPLTPFFTPERIFLLYCLAGGFIIGQLQFSFFFSKLKKKDLRHHGTGEYGATNAFRVLGAPLGILTFLLDFGKTILAIYIATKVLPMHPELAIDFHALVLYTGLGVVLGHIFPVYLKFNGGKGFSCTLATFLCLQDIKLIGVVILVFLVMFLVSRYVSLSSMVTVFFGTISFMFFMLMRWTYVETDWIFDCQCALVLLFVFCLIAHRSNIVRLVFGDERKFYFRKRKRLEALEEDYTNYDKYFEEVEAEETGLASVEAALLSGEAELAAEGLDEMTEAAEEAAVEAEEAAEEVVEETAEETIEADAEASEAIEETTETAEEAENIAEEAAEEAVETDVEAAEEAIETTSETVDKTAETTEEAEEELTEAAEESVEETTEEADETAEEIIEEPVEESVEEAAEDAAETTEEVTEAIDETAETETEIVEETEEETAEAAEETVEEVQEEAEEFVESAEEISETVEESAEETEEASEEAEETVEKAAAAAIPLAGFFGRIKSLFRKPEQQEDTEEFNSAESFEPVSDDTQETMEEPDETIEDHLKTKFKDFDITKKIGLSLGGEEENPEESILPENTEETPENETANVAAGGVFAAGFFGRMKNKLQKAVHPQEKEIPDFLSDDIDHAEEAVYEAVEETAETAGESAEIVEETVEETVETAEEATEASVEVAEEVTETADVTAEEITESVEETAEEVAEEVTETAEETVEEVTEAVEESAEDVAEEVTEAVEDVAEDIAEEVIETVEEAAEETAETAEELTGGVVLPGFFARLKAKVLRSVNLDEWKEDAQEASDEIENAAGEVFGSEETDETQDFEEAAEIIDNPVEESEDNPVEESEDNPVEELTEEPAPEPIEEIQEKAPSKFAGFLNKVRSILPNQGAEPEITEEEPSDTLEIADDVFEAAGESVDMTEEEALQLEEAGEEFFETVAEDLTEPEKIIEDLADEPKVGFFGKIRNKFRNFDISQKIGLSLNEENQEEAKEDVVENTEDFEEELLEKEEEFHDDLAEKVEDVKDSVADKVEDIKDSAEDKFEEIKESATEKVEDFKESLEDKADVFKESIEDKIEDFKEDLEIKEAETKAAIEVETEKVSQDLKETAEEISEDFKKKSEELLEKTIFPIKKRKLGREARRALASVTFRQKTSELKFGAKVQFAKWKATAELTADQLKKKQR